MYYSWESCRNLGEKKNLPYLELCGQSAWPSEPCWSGGQQMIQFRWSPYALLSVKTFHKLIKDGQFFQNTASIVSKHLSKLGLMVYEFCSSIFLLF